MEPLIVMTSAALVDQAATEAFELDMECSDHADGQNDFEATLPMHMRPVANGALYVDGTGWGGLVQERSSDTAVAGVLAWRGRTWQGVMFDRVLSPPSGQAYYTYSGTVAGAIDDLMSRLGLSTLFQAGDCPSASVTHTYSRYPRGWDALRELLGAAGLRPSLRAVSDDGVLAVMVDAAEPAELGEEVDGETADMAMLRVFTAYNHLIALGQGEGTARDVYHCYADSDGNVSATQSITGLAERVYLHDYPNADHDDLVESATEQLKKLQGQGSVSVSLPAGAQVEIGDYANAYDQRIDEAVSAEVTGCVVKFKDGALTVSWSAG